MADYQILEHTADIGIRIKAKDLKELFKQAAKAMFSIIAEEKEGTSQVNSRCIEVKQKAAEKEELFVNWLNELLSLAATHELVFYEFIIGQLTNQEIQAQALGKPTTQYRINTEIKAATYHGLKIEEDDAGWVAEVIFDV